jgi:hypothetical protein
MARNTYFVFKDIVQDCINAGKLREIELDVIVDTLAIASHGLIAKEIYCANFSKDKSDIVAHTLVDLLLRGLQR